MSLSLRDQLLQAGLVSEKQARQAEQQQGRQQHAEKKRNAPPPPDRAAEARKAQSAKAARDQAIERARREKAGRKALRAAIHQMVEQARLPRSEGGEPFHFVDGGKVRRIHVDAATRARLLSGELAIARHGPGHALLPREAAARVRERDPQSVIDLSAGEPAADAPAADDPYAAFQVPDDLTW